MKGTAYPVGEMLRRARKERNLTLERLSRSARVPPSTIWKYENEEVDYSFLTILKLSAALGKTFSYFLGRGDQSRDDVVASNQDDGVSCEAPKELWRLDLFNRRLMGHWLTNGILHLFSGADVRPRKAVGEEIFLSCLNGTIDILVGDRQFLLIEGYSMQFRINEQVRIRNRDDEDASAMLSATSFPFVI